jgi:hypothetical protein
MVEVTLWRSLGAAAGGKTKFDIEATSGSCSECWPHIDRGIAVAIDGVIYRDT